MKILDRILRRQRPRTDVPYVIASLLQALVCVGKAEVGMRTRLDPRPHPQEQLLIDAVYHAIGALRGYIDAPEQIPSPRITSTPRTKRN